MTCGLGFGSGFTPTPVYRYVYAFVSSSTGTGTVPMPTSRKAHAHAQTVSLLCRGQHRPAAAFAPNPSPTSYYGLLQFIYFLNFDSDPLPFLRIHCALAQIYANASSDSSPTQGHIWTQSPCLFVRFSIPIPPLAGVLLASSSKEGLYVAHFITGTLHSDSTLNQRLQYVR